MIDAELATLPAGTVVVHGAHKEGADALIDSLARARGFDVKPYPASWLLFGKRAGPFRNQQMLDNEHPDVVIAFRAPGISNGTDDMISKAEQRKIEVRLFGIGGRVR